MSDQVDALWGEFIEVVNDLAGTHAISVIGIIKLGEWLPSIAPREPTPDSTLFIGHGDPDQAEAFTWQHWRWDTLPQRLDADGPVIRELGQQWVVNVAAQWNDHYRRAIADALGVERNEIADPVMGDINKMRNDIVHHRGIATASNSGRCEVLRWFKPHKPMHVMPVHVVEFMSYLGLVRPTSEIEGGAWEVRPDSTA